MSRISAIICAYNEAKTIKEVVTTTCDYFFDEVIVVNDGSTDATSKILGELQFLPSLKYIELPENKGKGYAMATGIENTTGEIIVFIDADLSNVKEEHFEQLINPVLSKEADMVLGQATETLIDFSINPFKSFTGERALSKEDILPILHDMKESKFGVETLINLYYMAHEKKIKYVMLDGLKHPTKFEKTSQSKAIREFIAEGHQIALTTFNNYRLITRVVKNQIRNIKKRPMRTKKFLITFAIIAIFSSSIYAQDEKDLKLSGKLHTDQRLLLKNNNNWAWNENRLSLKLDKQVFSESKFYSEVWLRNIGLPNTVKSADLYNKGIVDPYNLEIREAYVQLNGFLTPTLDLTIGRQQIVWGTADKLNPTNNLNPYDLEDILDFGRKRGSDAINLQYYINNDFSLQGIFVPFFQPANMPVGIFANALNPSMDMPQGMVLKSFSDTLMMPKYNLGESSTAGLRFKGFAKGVDFSVSYVWGYDGLPYSSKNILTPVDLTGGISIHSQLSFIRNHIIGVDLVTSIAGVGVWAEAAAFFPDNDIVMTTDMSAFYPASPVPVTQDSVLMKKNEPYVKFVIGGDYFFPDGSYLNLQYLHGFIHERGPDELNDYFFLRYEKNFFNDKLKVSPIGGGFIVTDWNNIDKNYAIVYMPEITYKANPNTEISLACSIFDGKGQNLFAGLKDYNMIMFKMKYSF